VEEERENSNWTIQEFIIIIIIILVSSVAASISYHIVVVIPSVYIYIHAKHYQ